MRIAVVCVLAAVGLSQHAAAAESRAPTGGQKAFSDVLRPLFRQRCVKCHGKEGVTEGDVNLFELGEAADLAARPQLIRDLVDALDSEYMPPEDEPQLPAEQRAKVVAELQQLLHYAVAAQSEVPRTPLRRMNRFQYNNAVQDLFELNVVVFPLPERMMREHGDYFQPQSGKMPEKLNAGSRPLGKSQLIERRLAGVTPFPQDLRAEHGFDNQGDHLSLSPLLLESLLRLSRSIVESEDFNPQTCGIWNEFFAPPEQPRSAETESIVRGRLRKFLTRAFRREVEDELLDRYVRHVTAQLDAGVSFTDSMKNAAAAALASPRFFYLYDYAVGEDGETPGRIDDFDLASRLSFFLWGSIPDETLLELAADGKLHDPQVLEQQVERMLRDRRLKRFCDSFPAQWLQLERIISSTPDREKYPQFYFSKYRASMHMMLEPLLLFETLLIEDQSILKLIDSDFSYRSDLLEAWYRDGSQGNAGSPVTVPFRRAKVTDRRQGGVITSAAVMTMTSGPTRTKPITRGAWVASVILNDPPEPPPADVPPLADKPAEDEKDLTLRERFAAHRQRADCAGCHRKIDPLGFALENFDAAGIWRDKYENGRQVDAGGTLFGSRKFNNIVEFKDALLAEKDRFTRAFAAHLLAFALGREVDVGDSIALDGIVRETADADYRFHTLIKQIVLSEPFRR
jgi:mono/diheme cytochrome c family protein